MTKTNPFDLITKAAAIFPVLAAVYLSFRGFSGLGLTDELVRLLTALFASLSWMLSQALSRFLDVRKRNTAMAAAIAFLGAVFLIAEACLTHIGLAWLLDQGALQVPGWAIWFFSFSLSTTNVLAKWAFLGDPRPLPAGIADGLPQMRAAPSARRTDPAVDRTIARIADRVAAA